jgi:amino acid transporter
MAELKRVLGYKTILALTITSVMGTGMFFGAALGATYSGNASLISWVLLSVIAVYISTFFGELVSMFPKAGGVYEFSKHAYSRFFSFLIGWTAWLVGNLTTALLVVAAIDYLIPDPSLFWLKMGISFALIILLNTVAYFGIEASAFILVLFAITAFAIILSVIIPGAFQINPDNFRPFFTFGFSSLFLTIFFISENFFGWESATYLAEETKNPEKVIPRSLVWGTVLVAVMALGLVFVSLGIIPWNVLIAKTAPLSSVFENIYGVFGMKVLNVGVFLALIGSAAGGIVTMPRLILALARDKLFISQLSDVHPKHNTPYKAIIFQTIISLIVFGMAFGRYTTLLSILLPLGILMYIAIIFSVTILRYKQPNLHRAFKAPFGKPGSILIVIFLISLIVAWLIQEPSAFSIISLGFSFILMGIPIYLLLVMYYDPDTIIKVNDALAYFTLFTERFILPKKIRGEIMRLLGNVKSKTVLEFGCSVGTLTLSLANEVRPSGKVYATDLSQKDLMITKKRMIKKGHEHVVVIHDEHQVNRVHPDVPHVDAIVSIGMMGYLQDVKKVLKEMRDLLPYGGKIVFVDYADFFKIIPNVAWLSKDEIIEQIFREAGFSVYVARKKGLLWNYIFVYGIKFHEDIPYV